MWLSPTQIRKWRSDSIEARIYAIAEAEAHAQGATDAEAANAALEAVFSVLSWMYSRPYAVVKDMILDQFGCETSQAALSGFWSRFSPAWFAERNSRNAKTAQIIAEESQIGPLTDATLELIAQQALDIMSNPSPDPGQVRHFAKLLLQREKQSIDERKVALLEQKAAAMDAMEAKARELRANGGLSADQIELLERQLKLL